MKLPPGATGFHRPRLGDQADLKAFNAVCYHAARVITGSVSRVTPAKDRVTPSFHAIDITQPQHEITVLRHIVLPFIAFARPCSDGDMTITFVDHPALADAITNLTDAQILTVEQLDTPLSRVDLSALEAFEHDQIKYWKPYTVGELLFNFWD
jgi:hypothetical protein